MKKTLSVRVEVDVDVHDAHELEVVRRALADRAQRAIELDPNVKRVTFASSVLRRD